MASESREVKQLGNTGGKLIVLVTRKIPKEGIDILVEKQYDVRMWNTEDVMPSDVLLKNVQGVHAIFCTISDTISKEVLDAAGSGLSIVASMASGVGNINKFECDKRGIVVAGCPDVCSDAAAELAVGLLLLVTRRTAEGIEAVKNGEWGLWKPMWICGIELLKRTIGILGFGRVGFGVARRIKPFGVSRIIFHDVLPAARANIVGAEQVDMDTFLRESDIIVICCTLTPNTENLFNAKTFAKMKTGVVLINVSRGQVVNCDDLYQALKSGKLLGAGLDVTHPEPLPRDHPLHTLKNCMILPHLGTNAIEARINMAVNTSRNITSVLGLG